MVFNPVVQRDRAGGARIEPRENSGVVELQVIPMEGEALETMRISTEPLLRLRFVSDHEFKFDTKGECATVVLENTEPLKAYSREHVGSRLAVVVGGKIVTHHKIRVPLESDQVNITFCTKGGGDHLMKHLKDVLPVPTR
jgi:hypothetical protein